MPGPGRPIGLAKTGGRKKGTQNKSTPEKKEQTQAFFRRILDDEIEERFWRYFITGYEVVGAADGSVQIIPIPLDPVAWQAFRRAVEYKRGMPVQSHIIEDHPIADYGNLSANCFGQAPDVRATDKPN